MKIKELTVTAVIPTAQYANLQPSITVEVEDNDFELAKHEAMKHIGLFSKQYAEDGKVLSGVVSDSKKVLMTPYIGEGEVYFDEAAHVYTDVEGNVFQSASQFAKQFEHPFNSEMIIPVYAKKFGIEPQEIKDFWKAKADASTTFGTALHQALETYGKFATLADKLSTLEKPVNVGIHPTLLPIVESFFTKERLTTSMVFEPFVLDYKGERCGQIDLLTIVDVDKKICDIEDYKTNADLYKQNGSGKTKVLKVPYEALPNQPVSMYAIQLSYYKSILEANGWTVRKLKLHHWTGRWETIELKPVKIGE